MTETESANQVTILNKAINQYNLLQVRLDVGNIINELKLFLNAEVEIIAEQNGEIVRKVVSIGVPKANKKGIASLLNWVQLTINPQVVQGYFPEKSNGECDNYDRYIYEFQINLGDMIFFNMYEYDILESEAPCIIDAVMNLVIPFMSRLIGNRERESYGETFRETNNSTNTVGKSGFSFNPFKR